LLEGFVLAAFAVIVERRRNFWVQTFRTQNKPGNSAPFLGNQTFAVLISRVLLVNSLA
jgi:hypothetical protein